jgi:hypothetical protein
MKLTTNRLSLMKHLLGKILFSSQLIIVSAALPVLYCVGISHNTNQQGKVTIIRTNKGKTIMQVNGKDGSIIEYPALIKTVDL